MITIRKYIFAIVFNLTFSYVVMSAPLPYKVAVLSSAVIIVMLIILEYQKHKRSNEGSSLE